MIRLQDVVVTAGGFHLSGVNLVVPTGRYGVLMGKTGTGKTTLLESICGLRLIDSGKIYLMEEDVTNSPINQRGIGLVPQDLALFPTKTVREHLTFGPKLQQCSDQEIQKRLAHLTRRLELDHVLDQYPSQLSGGEKQRSALGRALSIEPKILCLDEPLSALDDATKSEMIGLLKQLKCSQQITVLHITHSESEAEQLADIVLTMDSIK